MSPEAVTRDQVRARAREKVEEWSARKRRHIRAALEATGHPPADGSEAALVDALVEAFLDRHPDVLGAETVEGMDALTEALI